jgi:hypothetical protein
VEGGLKDLLTVLGHARAQNWACGVVAAVGLEIGAGCFIVGACRSGIPQRFAGLAQAVRSDDDTIAEPRSWV